MKVTARGRIILNKGDRKALNIKPGDNLLLDRKTHKLYKMPTRKGWTKLINQMPCEEVSLKKDGSYDTSKAPNFRKWLKNG